jgi:hypothetical protein
LSQSYQTSTENKATTTTSHEIAMAMKKFLLTGITALLLATGTAHALEWHVGQQKPWVMWGDFPRGAMCISFDEVSGWGAPRDDNECRSDMGQNAVSFVDNGYEVQNGEKCRFISVKVRFDMSIPATTKTVGVYVYRVTSDCRHPDGSKFRETWDMYTEKTIFKMDKVSK